MSSFDSPYDLGLIMLRLAPGAWECGALDRRAAQGSLQKPDPAAAPAGRPAFSTRCNLLVACEPMGRNGVEKKLQGSGFSVFANEMGTGLPSRAPEHEGLCRNLIQPPAPAV